MAGYSMNLSDKKFVNICIDQIQNGDISGRIYTCFEETPLIFDGVGKFLRSMEQILDRHGFPMATVRSRNFGRIKEAVQCKPDGETEAERLSAEQVTSQKGAKGTFLVKIQCRQNATWQGNVMWGEKNCTQSFRSALELLKLIDSALDGSENDCADKKTEA